MKSTHNQELAPVYSEIRLLSERDAYVLHQAARISPGVSVRGHSAEEAEDVVWSAEQFVASRGSMINHDARDHYVNSAIDFITAGGFAVQVMVDMTTEVGGTTPTAVLDAYFAQMKTQLN